MKTKRCQSRRSRTAKRSVLVLMIAVLAVVGWSVFGPYAPIAAQAVHNRYIVVLNDNVPDSAAEARGLASRHGLGLGHVYKHALKGFSFSGSPVAAQALARNPRVAYVEADAIVYLTDQTLPTGVERMEASLNDAAKIDGVDDDTEGSLERVDVDVAIIDSGIDLDHPDLPPVVGGRHFYTLGKAKEDGKYDDDVGHGTHVAGIVAALDNDIGVVGVAPGARLWAVKVGSDGPILRSDVIKGIDFVTENAAQIEVANMSLGGGGYSEAEHTAIQGSVAAGVVYVVSAGNEGMDVYGGDGVFGTSDDRVPAALPEVIAVSAMGDTDGQPGGLGENTSYGTGDDAFASFTNYSRFVELDPVNPVYSQGGAIDVAAPGVDIYSTLPGGTYGAASGTSMAAPHVTGAVALEIAANGRAADAAGVAAIRQKIIDHAEPQALWGLANTLDPDTNPEGLVNVATGVPRVTIGSPASGEIFPLGTSILFSGTATDTGDGDLSAILEWTSDIDGWLYTGASFTVTNLSEGDHTILATVTVPATEIDEEKTGAASINITVGDPPPPPAEWNIEFVDNCASAFGNIAIAYDLDGNPSIGYFDDSSGNLELRFAHRTAAGWDIEAVSGSDLIYGVDLAYDPNDRNPSLTYVVGDKLSFAHRVDSTWLFSEVEANSLNDALTSLAYSPSGFPSIAYRTADLEGKQGKKGYPPQIGEFKCAQWNGTAWDTETVESGATARYKSLAYEPTHLLVGNPPTPIPNPSPTAGQPTIAYQDRLDDGSDTVKLARWNGTSWESETVGSGTNDYGRYTQLAYDPTTGYPAILHKTGVDGLPLFLYWDGDQWRSEIVCPAIFGSCARTGLAYNSSGTAMAAFHGPSKGGGSPGFAQRNGTDNWSGQAVQLGNNYGLNQNFFALAPDGTPSIAYVYRPDLDTTELRFAVRLPPVPPGP